MYLESIHTAKTIYKQKQEGASMDSFCSILYPMTTPDVPPEFQEVHKDMANMIQGVFEMPKEAKYTVRRFKIGSMLTDYMHHTGSLDCKGKNYDITILWKGSRMTNITPINRISVPYMSLGIGRGTSTSVFALRKWKASQVRYSRIIQS
jgi:hypothetical protein